MDVDEDPRRRACGSAVSEEQVTEAVRAVLQGDNPQAVLQLSFRQIRGRAADELKCGPNELKPHKNLVRDLIQDWVDDRYQEEERALPALPRRQLLRPLVTRLPAAAERLRIQRRQSLVDDLFGSKDEELEESGYSALMREVEREDEQRAETQKMVPIIMGLCAYLGVQPRKLASSSAESDFKYPSLFGSEDEELEEPLCLSHSLAAAEKKAVEERKAGEERAAEQRADAKRAAEKRVADERAAEDRRLKAEEELLALFGEGPAPPKQRKKKKKKKKEKKEKKTEDPYKEESCQDPAAAEECSDARRAELISRDSEALLAHAMKVAQQEAAQERAAAEKKVAEERKAGEERAAPEQRADPQRAAEKRVADERAAEKRAVEEKAAKQEAEQQKARQQQKQIERAAAEQLARHRAAQEAEVKQRAWELTEQTKHVQEVKVSHHMNAAVQARVLLEQQRLEGEWKAVEHPEAVGPQLQQENQTKVVKDWSIEDVQQLLGALDLEQYGTTFEDEEIDGWCLIRLNEEDLKEIGMKEFGDQRRLFLAVERLKRKEPPVMSAGVRGWTQEQVVEHLELQGLAQSAVSCAAQRVNGDVLLSVTREDIRAYLDIPKMRERKALERVLSELKQLNIQPADAQNYSHMVNESLDPAPPPPAMSLADMNADSAEGLCCPLSLEVMDDPVIAFDGMTYERAHIEKWLRDHDTSPMTGDKLESMALISNQLAKIVIADYRQGKLGYRY